MNTTLTPMTSTKLCCTCKQSLPVSLFGALSQSPDGLSPRCKPCFNAMQKASRERNPESVKAKRARYYASNKELIAERNKASRVKHADNVRAYKKAYKQNNAEKVREYQRHWYATNPEARKEHYRTRYEKNPAAFAQGALERKLCRRQATPAWRSWFFIEEIYRLARLRTKLTGIQWEVDHIVPLRAADACGLHVEHNLRVIPKVLNRMKGNAHG